MYSETDEFGTPYDQTAFPNVISEKKSDFVKGIDSNGEEFIEWHWKERFGPDLGVKDVSDMPPARPGQGAKL
jgi:hypothetical protein